MSAPAMRSVYLDYAAGAPLRPVAARVLGDALASGAANASSVHWAGARARALLESAREEVAAAIGARPLEVVFTSGATEANNLALAGVAAASGRRLRVAVPATEHASVLRTAEALAHAGHDVHVLPVDRNGRTDPAAVVATAPDLLSVALVNAETGVIQDCAALAAAARHTGARVHVDAAQAAAVLPLDVADLDCDLLTLSAHKVGGPAGVGALYVRTGVALAPLHHGGAQERGLRPGTENVAALAAFGAALAAATAPLSAEAARLAALIARVRDGIVALAPDARIAGDAARAAHILDVVFPDVAGESLVTALDLEGIAVSAGSACAAGASEPSHVLQAMGWDRAAAARAVRFSVGWASSATDVEAVLDVLPRMLARAGARRREAAWPAHAS
jgi:cysteine desulfurase